MPTTLTESSPSRTAVASAPAPEGPPDSPRPRRPQDPEGAPTPRLRSIPVGGEARLDRLLASSLGMSRAAVRRMLAAGQVLVNGRRAGLDAKGRPLAARDRVEVAWPDDGESPPIPEAEHPLSLLAHGAGWVAVDKSAGQPVHPYRGDERGTVLNALAAREPAVVGVGEGGLRSGVVHRLDVDTSGVLLFALNEVVWAQARAAFSAGRAKKRYRALVAGRLRGAGTARFDLYVARHRPAQVRVARSASKPRSKSWATALSWRSLEVFDAATLLEIAPTTGFLHQIRVSLSELGHPVLGDALYGGVEAAFAAQTGVQPARHLLHAASLAIPGLSGMAAESSDPPDFRAALRALREG